MTDGSPELSRPKPEDSAGASPSSVPRPSLELAGDQRLLALAAPRPEPLFVVLRRSAMLRPLLLLAATLPGLLVLAECVPDTRSALWGLRALDVLASHDIDDALRPGFGGASQSLLFQPPLQAWLVATSMESLGAARRVAPFLPSYLWSALTVWCLYRMISQLAGHRLAFLAALGFCLHPQVQSQVRSASPDALGTLTACLTVWLFLRHLQIPFGIVSWSLLGGGLSWGLCMLATGPLAIILAGILLIHAVVFPWIRQRTTAVPISGRSPRASFQRQLRSWLLLVITGVPVASWWSLMMSEQYGWSFQQSWWTGLPTTPPGRSISLYLNEAMLSARGRLDVWLILQTWVAGWAVLGFWQISSDWRRKGYESRRELYHLALIWGVVAVAIRLWMAGVGASIPLSAGLVEPLTIIPLMILAGVGVEAVLDRQATAGGVASAIAITAGLLTLSWTDRWWLVALVGGLVFAGILIGGALATRPFSNDRPWQEPQVRPLLMAILFCTLVGQSVECIRTALRQEPGSERLPRFRQRLADLPQVQRISVISPQAPPPVQLRLLLRSCWPAAELVVTEGWDPGLTQHLNARDSSEEARYLVVEWTRREINIQAETGSGWQVQQVADPASSYGRRLSAYLITPVPRSMDQIARSSGPR